MKKTLLSLGVFSIGLVVVSLLCLGLATPVQAAETNVTLWFSGNIQYKTTGGTTWSDFTKPSMSITSGEYTFRFSGDSNHPYVETNISVSGASMEKTIAYLRLTDHSGTGLAGGTARGGYTTPESWYVAGATNSDGALLNIRDGKPANLTYEMKFNNTTSVKGPQNPSVNSFFDFQTILLTLRLETSGGTPLDNSDNPRYGIGGAYGTWYFPGGVTGTSAPGETAAEFFPGTYSFEMNYKATAEAKLSVAIPNENTKLTWKTTKVTLYYSGEIAYGGTGDSRYFNKPSMELLGGTYWFNFRNGGTRTTLTISGSKMTKNIVALTLKDSNGNPLSGGKARGGFGDSYWTWWVSGLTDANGVLLDIRDVVSQPTNMSYEMRYNNTTQAKTQNVSANSIFQYKTILLTLRLETCGTTPLNGGKPRYGVGSTYTTWWFPGGVTGTSALGESKAEIFPGTYSFEMQYKATADAKLNEVIPNTNTTLTWKTTNVTLWFSGQIAYGGATGDSTWFTKPSMELLPGTYKFRFSGNSFPTTRTDITISGCTFEQTMVVIKLIDSHGVDLSGGTAKYYKGGWQDIPGSTNSQGILTYGISGALTGNTSFQMNYAYGSNEKSQNVSANSIVVFQTVNAVVQLKDHNGSPLDTGTVQYYSGGWRDLGVTTSGQVSKELLPLTYSFSMDYAYARQEKSQNVGTNPTVVFQTTNVLVELRDSGNNLLGNGDKVQYYSGGWRDLGNTSGGQVNKELLPLTYSFSMDYAFARQEKSQNIATDIIVVFQTTNVAVQLKDSAGVIMASSNGDKAQYYSGGWRDLGVTTSGQVSKELLPLTYSFSMDYAYARQEKSQNVGTNPTVIFQTVNAVVQLKNSGGSLIDTGTVEYYANGWRTFDSGSTFGGQVSMELLPNNYSFGMTYAYARNETSKTISIADSTVIFQTGKVHSDSGNCTSYYSGGWRAFTQDMELLPVTYSFHFSDGTGDAWSAITGGTENHIH